MSTVGAQHIEGLLSIRERYAPPARVAEWFVGPEPSVYNEEAFADPDAFWRARAARVEWAQPPTVTFTGRFDDPHWFPDGTLNATASCLDRHAESDAVAYHYLCEDGAERLITYRELLGEVNRLANALAEDGVNPGDRVCSYMPISIEGIVAMLACARIGAIHSVVYAGLGATALRERIEDARAAVLIAADVTYRRGKEVDLKAIVDDAVGALVTVRRVIVWQRAARRRPLGPRERDFGEYVAGAPTRRAATMVGAEHPLFILYTSGTTGKPKGVVMAHGGYLVGSSAMLADSTGITPDDVFWCTSDIGWIVGHSLMVYGALANRYRCVIREGAPDFPSPAATYETIQRLRVTKFYTSPTLARMLMRQGAELAQRYDLASLDAIYCAGEPLNPEAWQFLYEALGRERAAVCGQWWQTETGAMMMGYFPNAEIRPDRTGKALGPIEFDVVDAKGEPVPAGKGGLLVIRNPWPHMFTTVWRDRQRYERYFNQVAGAYVAGDVATCDDDGYYMVLGRADDVLKVAGHRIATADVESALVSHDACGEAAVIGKPDEIKGEVIKAFVVLRVGVDPSDALRASLIEHVRHQLGPIATPAELDFVVKLPKTRSGKIMRRLLKAQETGAELGDLTTLEE